MRPVQILLVEDSESDVLLMRRSLRGAGRPVDLHVAEDGDLGMRFLRKLDPYREAPTPDVVILDLNLPRMDGREVLAEIKSDPVLKSIPVIILTTSESEDDRRRCYQLHANCYITKPIDYASYTEVVRAIDHFWLDIVTLPAAPFRPEST